MTDQTDKAGEDYWSKEWSNYKIPDFRTIPIRKASNYIQWSYHQLFAQIFNKEDVNGKSILELGCGNSAWLAYFNKEWGMEVSGLDYSEEGCRKSRYILDKANVSGDVIHSDMFDAPKELVGRFDIVCSFGVIEHFEDTTGAVSAASVFLKPGGLLITTVPNHNGITGVFQKTFSKEIFDIHKILSVSDLDLAVKNSGLSLEHSGYFINFSLYANPGIPGKGNAFFKIKKLLLKITSLISRVYWWLELKTKVLSGSKSYSAAIFCVGRK
jgi:SAM-dependent methyltransferase